MGGCIYDVSVVTLATGGRFELAIDCFFRLLLFLSFSNFAAVAAKAIFSQNMCYVYVYPQKLMIKSRSFQVVRKARTAVILE